MKTADLENFSVREIEALRPRLRAGLRFSIQEQAGRRVCVIEDRAAFRFHRVGLAEYRFLRALDGTRPVAGLLAQLARAGGDAFTEGEALHMLRWLREQNLLELETSREGVGEIAPQEHISRAAVWLNPLVLKLPLARPDRFFTRVEPALRGVLGGAGFAVWLAVLLVGAAQVGMNWSRLTEDATGFLDRDNWLWLFLVWAGLKVAHEFSHGLFCKHYGAAVREVGAILVLFVPMGYVDATASLGLASRGRRIMVAAAGLYAEFFLAALAALVWAQTAPGTLHTVAYNTLLTGTVLTLFFNANPLLRFDGYFILSELLEVPNLATCGRAWAQRVLRGLLLGGRAAGGWRPQSRESWLVAGYGVAALVWQWLVLAGLLFGASLALRGGGLFFAVGAAIAWVALPCGRFVWSLRQSIREGGSTWSALVSRSGALAGVAALVLFVPWHRSVSSPGVVELADTQILRTECPGFVQREWVVDGEVVAAGQLLLELRDEEAASAAARSQLAWQQQELKARVAYAREDVATFQAEQARTEALRQAAAESQRYLATLQIRAPFAGRVTNRRLGQLAGVYFQPGEELLRLGRADSSEVKIAVSQQDEPHFREALDQPMSVRIDGRGETFPGQLTRVEARATRDLIHPALTALAGGPLALRHTEQNVRHENDDTAGLELAEPHFTAVVRLTGANLLSAGELAQVRFRSTAAVTLWSEVQARLARWLKRYSDRER